jgi:uncharacterized protein YgiM (DUF1202 family)
LLLKSFMGTLLQAAGSSVYAIRAAVAAVQKATSGTCDPLPSAKYPDISGKIWRRGEELMKSRSVLFAFCALLAAALACNLPGTQATPTPTATAEEDLAATITALAVALEDATSTSTAEASETPTITPTGTQSVPMVSVTTATNCRAGATTDFEILWALLPGDKTEVVGKYTPLNYWLVKMPGGGQCWLWGQYATVEGDVASIPEVQPPATPVPPTATEEPTQAPVPAAVSNLTTTVNCGVGPPPVLFLGGTLHWQDNADDEDGFHVYRGDTLVATLGPNVESYNYLPSGTYGVEAFNAYGASARKTITPACP